MAQLAAGAPRRIGKPRAAGARRRSTFVGPVLRMPSDRGCLNRLAPATASLFAGHLEYMLTKDPEMMALVASDPRFGRILRPLFHMIGRAPPPCVPMLPPRPPRARKPRAPRPPRPIRQVTGRALLKYLPWKKPRPFPPLPHDRRDMNPPDKLRKS